MKRNQYPIKRLLILTIVIFLSSSCVSSSFNNMSNTDLIETLKNKATRKNNGNLGMIFIENGEIYDSYYLSNGKLVDENTIFQMASVSKFCTTFGILKLVEDGLIDLNSPVSNYLTRWDLPESKHDNNQVTIRRLLSHTAGLTDGLGYAGFKNYDNVQTLEQSLQKTADSILGRGFIIVGKEPGKYYKYSGGGYTILQLLIEEVSNRTFNDYMKSEIFEPLGMTSSTFLINEVDEEDISECFKNNGEIVPYREFTALAAASLFTSFSDMTKFVKVFLKDSNGEPFTNTLISDQTILSMRKLQTSSNKYGLGTMLFAKTESGDFIFGHDGYNMPAVNTTVRINPETNSGIIIFSTGSFGIASSLGNDWVKWQINQDKR